MAGETQWTREQLLGIQTVGSSLLVSAAAGSGKTAILAERCAHLVCDATPCCDIDQLLVVTFTENAAAEMKARIEQALRRHHAQNPTEHLTRQLALIDHAQVSTLHGFCARLLRQHFHLLGLDPGFTILDGDEAMLLRNEIARELFADRYERDATGQFQRLIDAYGDGDDERLLSRVLSTHELLCSVVDPDRWRQEAIARIAQAAEKPLRDSVLGEEFLATIQSKLWALRQRCDDARRAIAAMGGFARYVAVLDEHAATLGYWQEAFDGDGLDALAEVTKDLDLPRLPSVPASTPNKEAAKALIDGVREQMKQGPLRDSLQFTEAQWQEGLRQILPHAQLLLDLVGDFAAGYAQAERTSRALDFADLERFAFQVLRRQDCPSAVARLYHQQFHHVLVDEYQDINELQDAILSLVSRECLTRSAVGSQSTGDSYGRVLPNLFCVGDVKQSIYRFRLADPARFLARHREFREPASHGQVIDLQRNFRSREPLLDTLNEVFSRLMTADAAEIDYDRTHWLHAGLQYPSADGAPCFTGSDLELHLLPTDASGGDEPADASDESEEVELDRTQREAVLLVRRIREMMGLESSPRMHVIDKNPGGQLHSRPIRYGDMVILLRSLRYKADQYASILRAAGIPVHTASSTGYFESVEVRDMLSLLRLLDNQQQDIPFAAVLRSPLAALPDPEDCLARIRLAYPSSRGAVAVAFHQAVIRYAQEQDDDLAARLRECLSDLKDWRELAHRRPLAEVIWTIYDKTGYLAFCAGLDDGPQRCANLVDLHERARQFGTFQKQGLYRFLRFLESLQDEADLGQPSVASQADDTVRIMSIHAAKGLEFPVVLLPDLGKRINLTDCNGPILVDRSAYVGLCVVDEPRRIRYPSLAWTLVRERLRRQALAEELRVLYVAMTRAKEHLILVATCNPEAPQRWTSLFANHPGPLPTDTILSARCMLDWLGPLATILATTHPNSLRVIAHDAEEIAGWPSPQQMRPRLADHHLHLAQLHPLTPPPPPNPVAQQIIDRLAYRYPHEPFTTLPAAQSITALTKHDAPPVDLPASPRPRVPASPSLPIPRCLLDDAKPTAIDRGSATHLLLQYLDFTRPCTDLDLAEQVNALVSRKLLAGAHAAAIDFDAVAWLLQTEIGHLLRQHHATLHRELPFYVPASPSSSSCLPADPLDQVMIRGRIDALIPTDQGLVILDYKTDRVTLEQLPARAEQYRPQVEHYRNAIAAMAHHPIAAVHLVFLTPRHIWSL